MGSFINELEIKLWVLTLNLVTVTKDVGKN